MGEYVSTQTLVPADYLPVFVVKLMNHSLRIYSTVPDTRYTPDGAIHDRTELFVGDIVIMT